MDLSSTFEKLSRAFKIEFDELAAELRHHQTAGEAREQALIALLRKYLPQRVGVDRGFVIDAHGGESRQIDVVIYDRTVGTVFEISEVKYFPCETVLAVGEVKSDINSIQKLQDALDKIRSAKELDRSNNGMNLIVTGPGVSLDGVSFDPATYHRDQVFGFIFTSTSVTRSTIISYLQNYNDRTNRRFWMNLFCSFNQFLISYESPRALYPSAMDAKYMYCTKDIEVPHLLLLFFCILATAVGEIHVARPSFFSYARISSTQATFHDLVLGGEAILGEHERQSLPPYPQTSPHHRQPGGRDRYQDASLGRSYTIQATETDLTTLDQLE